MAKRGGFPGGEKYPPLCRLWTHLRGQSGDGIPLLLQVQRLLLLLLRAYPQPRAHRINTRRAAPIGPPAFL